MTKPDPWTASPAETILLLAADPLGEARGLAAIAAAGAAPLATLQLDGAWPEPAAAVLVELADAEHPAEAALLATLSAGVVAARFETVVCCPLPAVDRVARALLDGPVDIVVGADPAERAAAVALMLARRRRNMVREDPAEDEAERRRLAEEAARLARTLNDATGGSGWQAARSEPAPPPPAETAEPGTRLAQLRRLVRERMVRRSFFPANLFGEPAWDMLLDLAIARETGARIAVSSLCIAAAVPTTTAIRWIRTLVEEGLFVRADDPADGRRSFVHLTEPAAAGMQAYLARI
ncbi:MAG: winged helix DNA-binding protein [Sphingomonas fennica]